MEEVVSWISLRDGYGALLLARGHVAEATLVPPGVKGFISSRRHSHSQARLCCPMSVFQKRLEPERLTHPLSFSPPLWSDLDDAMQIDSPESLPPHGPD